MHRLIVTKWQCTQRPSAPQTSCVWDYTTGRYERAPNPNHPFCTAHSHLSDGTIIAAGGEGVGGGTRCASARLHGWLHNG